jgi:hypothetical protein
MCDRPDGSVAYTGAFDEPMRAEQRKFEVAELLTCLLLCTTSTIPGFHILVRSGGMLGIVQNLEVAFSGIFYRYV